MSDKCARKQAQNWYTDTNLHLCHVQSTSENQNQFGSVLELNVVCCNHDDVTHWLTLAPWWGLKQMRMVCDASGGSIRSAFSIVNGPSGSSSDDVIWNKTQWSHNNKAVCSVGNAPTTAAAPNENIWRKWLLQKLFCYSYVNRLL